MSPFLGCYSHRLNLALKQFLGDYDFLLKNVHELMKKFYAIKKLAWLGQHTNLRPVFMTETRWSSAFLMVERFPAETVF